MRNFGTWLGQQNATHRSKQIAYCQNEKRMIDIIESVREKVSLLSPFLKLKGVVSFKLEEIVRFGKLLYVSELVKKKEKRKESMVNTQYRRGLFF